jgi:hypothetical protein
MAVLIANDAVGTLASSINDSVLTLALGSGQGALFPNPGAGDFFYITVIRASDGAKEIMRCTARSTDTLTVVRAQDGTTAKSFATSDRVELRPIRAIFNSYAQTAENNSFSGTQTFVDVAITDDLTVTDDVTVGGDVIVTGAVAMGSGTLASRKIDALNAGVTTLFRQTSVPTGWTKITTWDNSALRLISGTPSQKADAGDEFTTLFAARTIAAANLPTHTHDQGSLVTNTTGNHTHTISAAESTVSSGASGGPRFTDLVAGATYSVSTAGNHSHTITGNTGNGGFANTPMAFDVNYVDVYLASKDA